MRSMQLPSVTVPIKQAQVSAVNWTEKLSCQRSWNRRSINWISSSDGLKRNCSNWDRFHKKRRRLTSTRYSCWPVRSTKRSWSLSHMRWSRPNSSTWLRGSKVNLIEVAVSWRMNEKCSARTMMPSRSLMRTTTISERLWLLQKFRSKPSTNKLKCWRQKSIDWRGLKRSLS